ncbi:hypothetical protein Hypma_002075 [Hypsizygus marmoreus]|uniref:Uncharacterized protein n=1 Tax=Hypsizygus marmoreus TaxID=39966 RepID=A0A369K5U2_HYPMA|nr:hypothetical protein Hypma_002075 [Hypsizygus marmoreus]
MEGASIILLPRMSLHRAVVRGTPRATPLSLHRLLQRARRELEEEHRQLRTLDCTHGPHGNHVQHPCNSRRTRIHPDYTIDHTDVSVPSKKHRIPRGLSCTPFLLIVKLRGQWSRCTRSLDHHRTPSPDVPHLGTIEAHTPAPQTTLPTHDPPPFDQSGRLAQCSTLSIPMRMSLISTSTPATQPICPATQLPSSLQSSHTPHPRTQRPSMHHSDHADSHTHASPSRSQHRPASVSRENVQPRTLECQQRYDTTRIGERNIELARFDDLRGISASTIGRNGEFSPSAPPQHEFAIEHSSSPDTVPHDAFNTAFPQRILLVLSMRPLNGAIELLLLHSNRIQIPFASTIRLTAHLQPLTDHSQRRLRDVHALTTTTRHRAHTVLVHDNKKLSNTNIFTCTTYNTTSTTYTAADISTPPNPSTQDPGAHDSVTTPTPIWKGLRRTFAGGRGRRDLRIDVELSIYERIAVLCTAPRTPCSERYLRPLGTSCRSPRAQNLSYLTRKEKVRPDPYNRGATHPSATPTNTTPEQRRLHDWGGTGLRGMSDRALHNTNEHDLWTMTSASRAWGSGAAPRGGWIFGYLRGERVFGRSVYPLERERANAALLTEAHHRTAGVPGTEEQNPGNHSERFRRFVCGSDSPDAGVHCTYVRTRSTCGLELGKGMVYGVWGMVSIRRAYDNIREHTHTVKNALFGVSGGGRVLGRRGDEKKKGKGRRKGNGKKKEKISKPIHIQHPLVYSMSGPESPQANTA